MYFVLDCMLDYDFPFFLQYPDAADLCIYEMRLYRDHLLQYPDAADLCIHAMDGTEIMDIEILMFVRS
jgi:hypothetical protein